MLQHKTLTKLGLQIVKTPGKFPAGYPAVSFQIKGLHATCRKNIAAAGVARYVQNPKIKHLDWPWRLQLPFLEWHQNPGLPMHPAATAGENASSKKKSCGTNCGGCQQWFLGLKFSGIQTTQVLLVPRSKCFSQINLANQKGSKRVKIMLLSAVAAACQWKIFCTDHASITLPPCQKWHLQCEQQNAGHPFQKHLWAHPAYKWPTWPLSKQTYANPRIHQQHIPYV